jgi:parallel beta-helix repeat protein
MKKLKLAGAGIALALFAFLPLKFASAAVVTKTAWQGNMQGWLFYNDETDTVDNTLGSFVTGPTSPPLGSGSAQISVTGTQRRNLATYQFANTSLASITELKYSTYNPSTGNGEAVGSQRSGYLQFNVSFDGNDTWQRRLVYVPSANSTVTQDAWKEWDAIAGGTAQWSYSGATWPVTGEPGTTAKTWNQILVDYPSAKIRSTDAFFGVRVGEPYANGYTENIDKIVFATSANKTTFNFDNTSNDCVFVTQGKQYRLTNDCTTTATIFIPQGKTLDGKGHTITGKDPLGGHFLGAVVKNGGDKASVKNLKINANNLAVVCDADNDRLRGILFEGASGEISGVTIIAVNQGLSGCQEGNGIEVRNAPFYTPAVNSPIAHPSTKKVEIHNSKVDKFGKGGIVANGDVKADIHNNTVLTAGLSNYTAANGIQLAFGAKGNVTDNKVEGNQWCGGGDYAATAILIYGADAPTVEGNVITGNSDIGIAVEDTFGAIVKNNKISDSGTDCNVDGYDIGIENALFDREEDDGKDNKFSGNKVGGFTTQFDGVVQDRSGHGHRYHGRHHRGNCHR